MGCGCICNLCDKEIQRCKECVEDGNDYDFCHGYHMHNKCADEIDYFRVKIIVKEFYSKDSGHTFDHIMRVMKIALHIAETEPEVDLTVLKLAVLLHDLAKSHEHRDKTGKIDHALYGAEMAKYILKDHRYEEDHIEKIIECIKTHRYRSENEPVSIEAKILYDADKIDALGAIGIARSYMTAGEFHQEVYSNIEIDDYVKDNIIGEKRGRIKNISKHSPNIEFETKIKHLPESMYTKKGREIAEKRLKFMEKFFIQIKNEMDDDLREEIL